MPANRCLAIITAFLVAGGLNFANAASTIKPALTVRSTRSGSWSDSKTWQGGRVPQTGDNVLICEPHAVVYDVDSSVAIRVLKIAGKLRFTADGDTRLDVALIQIEPGEEVSEEGFECSMHASRSEHQRPALQVGSADQPIDARHRALIRLR
jgi:hypothetical protein